MKRLLALLLPSLAAALFLSGCLTSRVENSGGPGSITIPNTNRDAIRAAANAVFARYGYSPGRPSTPDSISFQRPAGRTGEALFGSAGQSTNFRVNMRIVPIPGTNDFRVMTQVYRMNVSRPGFESETPMMRLWSSQFRSALRDIKAEAANAGPARG